MSSGLLLPLKKSQLGVGSTLNRPELPCSSGLLVDSPAQLSWAQHVGMGKARHKEASLYHPISTLCLTTGSPSLHLGSGRDLCKGLLGLGSLALP